MLSIFHVEMVLTTSVSIGFGFIVDEKFEEAIGDVFMIISSDIMARIFKYTCLYTVISDVARIFQK